MKWIWVSFSLECYHFSVAFNCFFGVFLQVFHGRGVHYLKIFGGELDSHAVVDQMCGLSRYPISKLFNQKNSSRLQCMISVGKEWPLFFCKHFRRASNFLFYLSINWLRANITHPFLGQSEKHILLQNGQTQCHFTYNRPTNHSFCSKNTLPNSYIRVHSPRDPGKFHDINKVQLTARGQPQFWTTVIASNKGIEEKFEFFKCFLVSRCRLSPG